MKRTTNRLTIKIGLGLMAMALIVGFNNCQGTKEGALNIATGSSPSGGNTAGSVDGITGTLCEQDIKREYTRSWMPFLATNCASCHSTGPGKGRFTNSNINTAYDEFMLIGFDKTAKNATSPNHNPPYTGTQHFMDVNTLKVDWLKTLENYSVCSGDSSVIPVEPPASKISMITSEKELGLKADNEVQTYTWAINSDIRYTNGTEGSPNIPGGSISIQVGRYRNSNGTTFYSFFNPTISGNTTDVNIQSIFVRMNGLLLNYPTTFNFLNANIRRTSGTAQIISNGSMVAPKAVFPADKISLSFVDIKQISMPPPPTPKIVNITNAKVTVLSNGEAFKDVTITLNSASTENILVSLNENSDMCGTTYTFVNDNQSTLMKKLSASCMPEVFAAICPGGSCSDPVLTFGRSRSIQGSAFRRFDWDHRMVVTSVTFLAGETSKTVRVDFSTNTRKEFNRLYTIEIGTISGLASAGANNQAHFVLNKHNNPEATVGVLRYSELMNRNFGVLGLNCVKCHNSTDNAGGYDMTDYDLMVNNRVLIPSAPNTSKMYIRMNPNKNTGSKPMPLDGYRPNDEIYEVEKWILDGAKNN